MVYNTQDYWFLDFSIVGILETRKHDVWKLDLFPSSGKSGEEDTQLGPLERANLQGLRLALSKRPN
jgi:hypothetical protein